MAPSIKLVHRFRPWRAVWPKKIDPKTGQHQEPGDEDEPIPAPPPDASRNRIFAHGNRNLLLPSKTSELYTPLRYSPHNPEHSLLVSSSWCRPRHQRKGFLQRREETRHPWDCVVAGLQPRSFLLALSMLHQPKYQRGHISLPLETPGTIAQHVSDHHHDSCTRHRSRLLAAGGTLALLHSFVALCVKSVSQLFSNQELPHPFSKFAGCHPTIPILELSARSDSRKSSVSAMETRRLASFPHCALLLRRP